jgi:hypothetical protein
VQQLDPCTTNGATTVNREDKAIDCEPIMGTLRWIIP